MPQLCKGFDVNLFESELRLVREIEKTLNPKKVFEEKLNIAASGDRHALSRYHAKLLSKKIGKINESINKLTEEQYNRINSELDQFKSVIIGILTPIYEHLKLMVNESGTMTFDAAPAQVVDFSKLDSMGAAASGAMPSNWTILGVLDKIGRALTGNYDWLGIFQLVLDLLGLIPGYGIVFDIINALIYLFNGEYVLMVLSLVACIPGLGDAVALSAKALVKPIAKTVQEIFGLLIKKDIGGTAKAINEGGPAVKSFFREYVRPMLTYVPKLISNGILMINDLARFLLGWTSYIPWVGTRVKGFFSYIESSVVKFKAWLDDVDSTLLKSLDEVEVLAKVSKEKFLEVQMANSKILRGGGSVEYIEGTQNVVFKSADGKVLTQVDAKTFVDEPGLFGKKFPGSTSTKTQAEVVTRNYTDEAGKKITEKELRETNSWIFTYSKTKSTPKLIKGLAGMTKNLFTWRTSVILGKYIYMYFTGGHAIPVKIEGTPVNILDEADYAYVSSAALTDYVQQAISARRKQTGEIYNPTVVFNSMDLEEKQGFDMTQSYLRDMARKTGQPSIIPVIYDKYKSEMDTELVGALDETFASLLQKEEEERLATERGENVVVKSKDGDEIEIAGIKIEEAYSRKNWTNPLLKFK
jgi:anti-anti-sigma regulatory factor